ncbi:hypothetical protein TNCT_398081 [Trichonephila clavata]|uniref:Uncharacterized protein n=1 Tax=Trichonephila clavata TaxID=2740835 RepID=A0A8X6FT59_TRICU|nr:hypothetical protein TNCT_398081 [Trichonephila clavata]
MALSFMMEIALHLMHWIFYFSSGYNMPSFLEILIFQVGMEIGKNFYFNHHCISKIGSETILSLDETVLTNDPRRIPQVHSPTVYAICKALELTAELVPLQDNNQN